jgi:hypothetical protein
LTINGSTPSPVAGTLGFFGGAAFFLGMAECMRWLAVREWRADLHHGSGGCGSTASSSHSARVDLSLVRRGLEWCLVCGILFGTAAALRNSLPLLVEKGNDRFGPTDGTYTCTQGWCNAAYALYINTTPLFMLLCGSGPSSNLNFSVLRLVLGQFQSKVTAGLILWGIIAVTIGDTRAGKHEWYQNMVVGIINLAPLYCVFFFDALVDMSRFFR